MDLQELGAYLVVKILSNNRGKYGCIPNSWVKVKDNYDNTVVFGYPAEDRIDIKMRVIENQPLDTKWPTIFGEVVFHTESQEDAFQFLDTKTEDENDTQDQSKDINNQDVPEVKVLSAVTTKTIDQPKRKRGRPRKRKLSDHEILSETESIEGKLDKELELQLLEAEKLINTYASDSDDDEAVISSTASSSHNVKTPDTTQTLPSETCNVVEETPVNQQITQQPSGKSSRYKRNLSKGYQGYSDEDFETSDDSGNTPKTIHPKLPRPSGQRVPDQEINTNLLNDQVYSECYNFYVELNDSYQKSMSILDSAENYLQNVISAHKGNVEAKAKRQSSPTSQQADAINADMFSHPQPLLQVRRTSSVSEEDTRWTVRHPEPGSDLIELMPNTGVYVSKKGLNECHANHNGTTKFTRALLAEVFTDEALKNCSFTGQSKKKIRKNPRKTPKPGLDPKARETFFNYVLKYSLNMGWDKADPEIIMSCIKNRLQTLSRNG